MDAISLRPTLTYEKVKETYEKKGYAFFDTGDHNLNIFGIRCTVNSNKFDDLMGCAYRLNGKPQLKIWPITTDAGIYWLKNPMNKKGTAILAPGQYRKAYKIGKHLNDYEALVQIGGKVKVFRDGDMDLEHDMDPATLDNGFFGINLHRSNPFKESYNIDKWSAGCQVHATPTGFNEMMSLARKAAEKYGNSFTYTLFEIKDFR